MMTPDEIRLRSRYLYLTCSEAIDRFKDHLTACLPMKAVSSAASFDGLFRKELGLLVRYWATQEIWHRLESQELDAKQLNLEVLRLFVEGVRLPRDGSGLRYAELSNPLEEARELTSRLARVLQVEPEPLLHEIEVAILPWREVIIRAAAESVQQSPQELSQSIKVWSERVSPPPSAPS